jgi:hypothetical protein
MMAKCAGSGLLCRGLCEINAYAYWMAVSEGGGTPYNNAQNCSCGT